MDKRQFKREEMVSESVGTREFGIGAGEASALTKRTFENFG
jgi:hypothetical protein